MNLGRARFPDIRPGVYQGGVDLTGIRLRNSMRSQGNIPKLNMVIFYRLISYAAVKRFRVKISNQAFCFCFSRLVYFCISSRSTFVVATSKAPLSIRYQTTTAHRRTYASEP